MHAEPLYRELLVCAQRMLAAARAQDWEALSALGEEQRLLAERLPAGLPTMPTNESGPLAETIREILATHEEIAALATPWLKHTRQLLQALEGANPSSQHAPR